MLAPSTQPRTAIVVLIHLSSKSYNHYTMERLNGSYSPDVCASVSPGALRTSVHFRLSLFPNPLGHFFDVLKEDEGALLVANNHVRQTIAVNVANHYLS